MSSDDVAFDLEFEEASNAERDIGKLLAKEMNNELVEEARSLVEERYKAFLADLPEVVVDHNPDYADDLKPAWMKHYYFTTLKDFMHRKNHSGRRDGPLRGGLHRPTYPALRLERAPEANLHRDGLEDDGLHGRTRSRRRRTAGSAPPKAP